MHNDRDHDRGCAHTCSRALCLKAKKPDPRQLTLAEWLYIQTHDEMYARLTVTEDLSEKEEINKQYSQRLDTIKFAW